MPCAFALQACRVPARRWATRADLTVALEAGREHLETGPLQQVTPASAAHFAGISPFHFQRLFRSVYGVTPHQVVAARRLEAATRLLAHTQLPLWRIARQVGLAGAPALCRFVRSHLGLPPSRLRRSPQFSKKG